MHPASVASLSSDIRWHIRTVVSTCFRDKWRLFIASSSSYPASMPSYLHELFVAMFRNRSKSAPDLLLGLEVPLPEYDGIQTESSDINDVKPAEYRADLVLFLVRGSRKLLGVIVEVQLRRDKAKPYTWPAYLANLRARHRCPVCLLVITAEEAVARWARTPIPLGPGSSCEPWVIGPSNMPVFTELRDGGENAELIVLSAIEHRQNADVALSERIASAAILAIARLDGDRCKLYLDLLSKSIFKRRKELEVKMNSLGYRYQSEFARHYVAEGKAEGLREGCIDVILKQLTARFGSLPDRIQTRVRGAQDAELAIIAERVLTARTLKQVFDKKLRR